MADPNVSQYYQKFPSVNGVKDADDIINDTSIDAVVIATSVFSHFPLAKKAFAGR